MKVEIFETQLAHNNPKGRSELIKRVNEWLEKLVKDNPHARIINTHTNCFVDDMKSCFFTITIFYQE